jgi:hypothetical protein
MHGPQVMTGATLQLWMSWHQVMTGVTLTWPQVMAEVTLTLPLLNLLLILCILCLSSRDLLLVMLRPP